MLKHIISIIPELLGVIFGDPARISHRWIEFKEDMAEYYKHKAKKEARSKEREDTRPSLSGCVSNHMPFRHHHWEYNYQWNSGIYDGGATGRAGWKCYHCTKTVWDQTDAEFVKEQPAWLLVQATRIPASVDDLLSPEVAKKRSDFHHDRGVRALMNEQKNLRERLAEIDEVEQNGGMLLTGNT